MSQKGSAGLDQKVFEVAVGAEAGLPPEIEGIAADEDLPGDLAVVGLHGSQGPHRPLVATWRASTAAAARPYKTQVGA